MILLNNIIQAFALPDLDTSMVLNIIAFGAGRVSTTFIDIN